jgi:Arc/MetJ-type ribon-helix-helix transcriptional regulator
MARSISVSLDDRSDRSLRVLRAMGLSDPEAVRFALREAASAALRGEAAALAADAADRREAASILEEMEELAPRFLDS